MMHFHFIHIEALSIQAPAFLSKTIGARFQVEEAQAIWLILSKHPQMLKVEQ